MPAEVGRIGLTDAEKFLSRTGEDVELVVAVAGFVTIVISTVVAPKTSSTQKTLLCLESPVFALLNLGALDSCASGGGGELGD